MRQVTAESQSAVRTLLREVVLGPDAEYGLLLERDAGFIPTLAGINAKIAATPAALGRPSLAQHVRHAAMSMRFRAEWLEGRETQPDWFGVWTVPNPDDGALDKDAWIGVQQDLRTAYEAFDAALERHPWPGDFEGLLAVSTHVAYHLAIVRQLSLNLRAQSGVPAA